MEEPNHADDPTPWVTAAVAALAVALLYGAADPGAQLREFPLDDAWIHHVYARGLWRDGLPTYNPGEAEAGFSSLGWLVVLSLWSAITHAVTNSEPALIRGLVVGTKMISLGFGLLTAAGVGRWVRRLGGGVAAGHFAVIWTMGVPAFSFAATSGMEVTLASAALVWGLVFDHEGRSRAAGWCLALAGVARPECAIVIGLVVARRAWLVRAGAGTRRSWLETLVPSLALALAWVGYDLAVTGHPLPNTFYAKAHPEFAAGLGYLAHDVLLHPGAIAFALAVVAIAFGIVADPRARGWILAAWLLPLVAVALSRNLAPGVEFYMRRYFTPFAPIAAVLIALGVASMVERWLRGPALRVAVFALPILALTPALLRSVESQAGHVNDVDILHGGPARGLIRALPPDVVVAVEGAGAAAFFGEHRVVDVLGLNDHVLAHAPGLRACIIVERAPGVFVVPAGMLGAIDDDFVLRPLQGFWVEKWSVVGGTKQRRVLALAAQVRPESRAHCQRRLEEGS